MGWVSGLWQPRRLTTSLLRPVLFLSKWGLSPPAEGPPSGVWGPGRGTPRPAWWSMLETPEEREPLPSLVRRCPDGAAWSPLLGQSH